MKTQHSHSLGVLSSTAERPYMRLGLTVVYVSDVKQATAFYIGQLGLTLVAERALDAGGYFVAVALPDGPTVLGLVVPAENSAEVSLIGRTERLSLITEDVDAVYRRWKENGVVFQNAPEAADWEGTFARLQDPDGNLITLAGFDRVTKALEQERFEAAKESEAQRRATQDLAIARDVQMRLLPQNAPWMHTLDFAGRCMQSRSVGGDYYDFLDYGNSRIGLVVGDIAGKGIAAALSMVSLQANLRSQMSYLQSAPVDALRIVNARLHESSLDSVYATLFLGEYDDASRRFTYVNCGHLSGLVLRADGRIDRLKPTATVLGLFPIWHGLSNTCTLHSEDCLVLYTDGITEHPVSDDEEFGEERLIRSLQRHRNGTSRDILDSILRDLHLCGNREASDDVTLIVAKGR